MRHGIADAPVNGQPDRMRALTPEGVTRMERQAHAMKKAGWNLDKLISSSFVRARQTAAIVARALGIDVLEDQLISPDTSLDDFAELVSRLDASESVMIVGHQPSTGRLVYDLTGALPRVDQGTLAILEVAAIRQGGATLVGLYDPEDMMRFGR